LWATSPVVAAARAAGGAAMKDPVSRFWFVEHGVTALVGVVLVHVGYGMAKRGAPDLTANVRYRRAALMFGLALVCFLVATPWPFRLVGRPLLHF